MRQELVEGEVAELPGFHCRKQGKNSYTMLESYLLQGDMVLTV